jgi:hypothetical protein
VGSLWHKPGEEAPGWHVLLWRAAHHFLPEDPGVAPTAPGAEAAAGAAGSPGPTGPADPAVVAGGPAGNRGRRRVRAGDGQASLDQVLRTAAQARAAQQEEAG